MVFSVCCGSGVGRLRVCYLVVGCCDLVVGCCDLVVRAVFHGVGSMLLGCGYAAC